MERADCRAFDGGKLHFVDVQAGVDAVVSKPGYDTMVEALCVGVPLLCLDYDEWPEAPWFDAWDDCARTLPPPRRERMKATGSSRDV